MDQAYGTEQKFQCHMLDNSVQVGGHGWGIPAILKTMYSSIVGKSTYTEHKIWRRQSGKDFHLASLTLCQRCYTGTWGKKNETCLPEYEQC